MQRSSMESVIRLDLADVRRSRWLGISTALYALIAAVFVFSGLRESAVLGFTGMGRVLMSVIHFLLLLLPLLALMLSGAAVGQSRQDGTLELLFSHPLGRDDYFLGITLVRYGALVVPLLSLMLILAFLGWAVFGDPIGWAALLRELAICGTLIWCFVGLGFAVSVSVRNSAKAAIYLLLVWVSAVALLDFAVIGLMLEWRLNALSVFFLAALNPVEAARMGLLSAADPTLANLGPVGFYLSTRVGPGALLVLGILWPLASGTAAWFYARREFCGGDLI